MQREIYSDNAHGFRNAQKQFRCLSNDQQLQAFVTKENLRCHFQMPCSPWKGGHYERFVGLVKSALSSSIHSKRMSEADLFIVLKEVQLIVNSRPLTYLEDDLSLDTLMPNKLLFSRDLHLSLLLCHPAEEDEWNAPSSKILR